MVDVSEFIGTVPNSLVAGNLDSPKAIILGLRSDTWKESLKGTRKGWKVDGIRVNDSYSQVSIRYADANGASGVVDVRFERHFEDRNETFVDAPSKIRCSDRKFLPFLRWIPDACPDVSYLEVVVDFDKSPDVPYQIMETMEGKTVNFLGIIGENPVDIDGQKLRRLLPNIQRKTTWIQLRRARGLDFKTICLNTNKLRVSSAGQMTITDFEDLNCKNIYLVLDQSCKGHMNALLRSWKRGGNSKVSHLIVEMESEDFDWNAVLEGLDALEYDPARRETDYFEGDPNQLSELTRRHLKDGVDIVSEDGTIGSLEKSSHASLIILELLVWKEAFPMRDVYMPRIQARMEEINRYFSRLPVEIQALVQRDTNRFHSFPDPDDFEDDPQNIDEYGENAKEIIERLIESDKLKRLMN